MPTTADAGSDQHQRSATQPGSLKWPAATQTLGSLPASPQVCVIREMEFKVELELEPGIAIWDSGGLNKGLNSMSNVWPQIHFQVA